MVGNLNISLPVPNGYEALFAAFFLGATFVAYSSTIQMEAGFKDVRI
jgi:hypothetical protein